MVPIATPLLLLADGVVYLFVAVPKLPSRAATTLSYLQLVVKTLLVTPPCHSFTGWYRRDVGAVAAPLVADTAVARLRFTHRYCWLARPSHIGGDDTAFAGYCISNGRHLGIADTTASWLRIPHRSYCLAPLCHGCRGNAAALLLTAVGHRYC